MGLPRQVHRQHLQTFIAWTLNLVMFTWACGYQSQSCVYFTFVSFWVSHVCVSFLPGETMGGRVLPPSVPAPWPPSWVWCRHRCTISPQVPPPGTLYLVCSLLHPWHLAQQLAHSWDSVKTYWITMWVEVLWVESSGLLCQDTLSRLLRGALLASDAQPQRYNQCRPPSLPILRAVPLDANSTTFLRWQHHLCT